MTSINRRDFVKNVTSLGIVLGIAPSFACGFNGGAQPVPKDDPYALVDPELLPEIKQIKTRNFSREMLATARQEPGWPIAPPPAPQPVEQRIPGAKGAPDVRVFVFDPSPGKKNRPAYLHIHGGGYVAGTPNRFSMLTQKVAQSCDCVVVSVDYRLAPETPFPGSLEDNYAALRWLHTNADQLGVDRRRIAIGGESAGGGHSAMLAIAARDRREFPIALQVLIYPMLDDRTGSTRPVPPHIGKFIWTAASNNFGWTSLLGKPAGSAAVPAGSVPARVEDLSGVPPAFIGVGAIDLFVEEDVEYGRRLINAGVPTELLVVPGAYHGFNLIAPTADVSVRFDRAWLEALKRAFAKA